MRYLQLSIRPGFPPGFNYNKDRKINTSYHHIPMLAQWNPLQSKGKSESKRDGLLAA